ncbi:MAG: hypothetical protein ACLGG0_09710 [Bacteriovoracia bacterium]
MKRISTEKIEVSAAAREAALTKFENTPVISMDDALKAYKAQLDDYCIRFNAKDHSELMTRADELEFEHNICSEILDKYSFINRNGN